MSAEVKARQIEATRKLGEMLSSLGNVESEEHRISYAYNEVCDAVAGICQQNQANGQPVFTSQQIECITQISFRLFGILDSKIKPPPPPSSAIEALSREYKALPALKKWKVFGAVLTGFLSIIGVVEAAKAGYSYALSDHSKAEKHSTTDTTTAPKR